MAKDPSRKSFLEMGPAYLGGIAALVTALGGIFTIIYQRGQSETGETGPAPSALTAGCRRIVGSWQWYTADISGVLTFGADRQVSASPDRGSPPVLLGSWACDGASGAYTISWQNQVTEKITLDDDGRTASGYNNLNMPIRGSALQ